MSHAATAHAEEDHGPQTFFLKYVWSQDHKVIAVQYASIAILVGLIGLGWIRRKRG